MNMLPSCGVPLGSSGSSGGGGSPPMADGYYYVIQASATPPDPTDPAWTATTKFDDVGVNDQTTYEGVTDASPPTDTVFAMKYVSAGQLWQSYTAELGFTEAGSVSVLYWTGVAWDTWDSPLTVPHGGALAWLRLNRNPGDQTGVAVCIGLLDGGATSLEFIARIGDFRPA
jgi:hypothetical protein